MLVQAVGDGGLQHTTPENDPAIAKFGVRKSSAILRSPTFSLPLTLSYTVRQALCLFKFSDAGSKINGRQLNASIDFEMLAAPSKPVCMCSACRAEPPEPLDPCH